MGWLDFFKKKKEDDEDINEEDDVIRLCQGCGIKEDDDEQLRILKHNTTDGMYSFLFCRKCYRKMKKGKLPPLIAQMQSQGRR
jgi:hypothetical protein